MSESPSARLRAAIAALHERVERGTDVLRRTDTLEGYAELLRGFLRVYEGLEPRLLQDLGPAFPPSFLVERAPRLRADLRSLGYDGPEDALTVDPFDSPDHALGGLYVVEGAALGGQIVARHLLATHGLTAERGASFFASGGEPVGPRWKAFRGLLDGTEDFDAVLSGATATFELFERTIVREPLLA